MKGIAILCAGVVLTACGGSQESPVPAGVQQSRPSATDDAGHTLALTITYEPGPAMYVEGAVGEVLFTDARGRHRAVRTSFDVPDKVLQGLQAGTYTLHAGLRPCDGTDCDASLADTCGTAITVPAATAVRVRFMPGAPCEVIGE